LKRKKQRRTEKKQASPPDSMAVRFKMPGELDDHAIKPRAASKIVAAWAWR
jgi:hypothetical protein